MFFVLQITLLCYESGTTVWTELNNACNLIRRHLAEPNTNHVLITAEQLDCVEKCVSFQRLKICSAGTCYHSVPLGNIKH